MRSAQVPISLEKPVGDDEESEFGHFIPDDTAPAPDEAADLAMRKEALAQILASLTTASGACSSSATGSTGSTRARSTRWAARST